MSHFVLQITAIPWDKLGIGVAAILALVILISLMIKSSERRDKLYLKVLEKMDKSIESNNLIMTGFSFQIEKQNEKISSMDKNQNDRFDKVDEKINDIISKI